MLSKYALPNTPTTKLIVGLSLCAIGAGMLYAYFKTRDDVDNGDFIVDNVNGGYLIKLKSLFTNRTSAKKNTIELTIKKEYVPSILGRDGVNLRTIEEKTETKIHFREINSTQVICKITGYPEKCNAARIILLKEIERLPIITEEIYVPLSVIGKIIGRCGEALQEICRISMAKVSLDSTTLGHNDTARRILISGNRHQVNIAYKLIEDKIEEHKSLRQTVDEIEQKREPRRSPITTDISSSIYASENSISHNFAHSQENSITTTTNTIVTPINTTEDNCLEVYVSAIATPSKFWLQLIGQQTKELDDLVSAMTDYYDVASNRNLHIIQEPYLGQIVATIFKHDNKWYRAEVVGILPNQYNPNEVVLDLYFVDYGDNEYALPNEIFELRTDFLTLRFQAVECFLANVQSTSINNPDIWESKSIEAFEKLTKVARWKKLISRLKTHKYRFSTGDLVTRESSPIPGVELYDVQDGVEVNLGDLLIQNGYALPIKDNDASLSHIQQSYETTITVSPSGQQEEPKSKGAISDCNQQIDKDEINSLLSEKLLQNTQKDNDKIPSNGERISVGTLPTPFLNNSDHHQLNSTNP